MHIRPMPISEGVIGQEIVNLSIRPENRHETRLYCSTPPPYFYNSTFQPFRWDWQAPSITARLKGTVAATVLS